MSAESRRLVEASQTLGAVFLAGCLRGKRLGVTKVEPCGYSAGPDLESLIWTRGAKFPCWRPSQRLKCPRCGGMSVEVAWLHTRAKRIWSISGEAVQGGCGRLCSLA